MVRALALALVTTRVAVWGRLYSTAARGYDHALDDLLRLRPAVAAPISPPTTACPSMGLAPSWDAFRQAEAQYATSEEASDGPLYRRVCAMRDAIITGPIGRPADPAASKNTATPPPPPTC